MYVKKKKSPFFLALIALVFLLVGCGSNKDGIKKTYDSKMTFEEVANALYSSDSSVVEDLEKKAVVVEID